MAVKLPKPQNYLLTNDTILFMCIEGEQIYFQMYSNKIKFQFSCKFGEWCERQARWKTASHIPALPDLFGANKMYSLAAGELFLSQSTNSTGCPLGLTLHDESRVPTQIACRAGLHNIDLTSYAISSIYRTSKLNNITTYLTDKLNVQMMKSVHDLDSDIIHSFLLRRVSLCLQVP